MRESEETKVQILNIQIGCMLRLARLEKGQSQHDLSILLETSSTMIGRVERAENVSGWDKIFSMSRLLDINFASLFVLKNEEELLAIVEKSLKYEGKLTKEKVHYYDSLKKHIVSLYRLIK